jgi:glycosyltransferase involved in cell wall biosynthesis
MACQPKKPDDVITEIERDRIPLITVAMPIYNAGKFLRMAVKSILLQTLSNWELLIIDDGSTDDALSGIADIIDPRIRILSDGQNHGLAGRLNQAIDLAQGEFFARMDQDDAAYPDRFSLQLAMLQKDRSLDLVATRAILIDSNDIAIGQYPFVDEHETITARPWQGFHFPHPTWMGRLSWFKRHRYAQPAPYFCEDQELLLRSFRSSRFATVNQVAFAYRVRNRFNPSKQMKTRLALWRVQRNHFLRQKQPLSALLSTGVLAARLLKDRLCIASWVVCRQLPLPSLSPDLVAGWEKVRNGFLENPSAR